MKAFLKFTNKTQTFDLEIHLNNRAVVGRGHEYNLTDEKVSSNHCTFTLTSEYLKISDNKSKNGTYLNGIRIESAEVFIGDEVKIGDTIICLNEKRMDQKAVADLTFPGPAKQRIDHELRVDFTGARIQNQLYNHAHPDSYSGSTPSQVKEIDLRKRARTKIRLSKQEIKLRHQKLAQTARYIDIFLMMIVFMFPIFYVINAGYGEGMPLFGLNAEAVNHHMANLIGGGELIVTGAFSLINMRYLEFSFGEKLAGIEKIYQVQGGD